MPARLLQDFPQENSGQVVINRSPDGCLNLYTLKEWKRISKKLEVLNTNDPDDAAYLHFFFGLAEKINLDNAHRFVLPTSLRDYAGIEKEAVMLGMGRLIQIWSPENYKPIMEPDPEKIKALAARYNLAPDVPLVQGQRSGEDSME